MFLRFGSPSTIVSDRGPQFISQFWSVISRACRVELKMFAGSHTQNLWANGKDESRTNQIFAFLC